MADSDNATATGAHGRRSAAGTQRRSWWQWLLLIVQIREASIVIAGIALVVYFQWASPYFLTAANIGVIGQFTAATAIIAAGQVMVLVSRELDLSVGQVYALSPLIMYFALQSGLPVVVAVLLGMAAAALVGLLNGAITVGLKVPSFVTTLGMLFFVNGLNLTISGGFPVQPDVSAGWATLFGASIIVQMLWAVVLAVIFQFVLNKTRWGLHTIATGGNPVGSAEVGIPTGRVKMGNFMICSVLGGFAGILDSFRIGSIDPLAGGEQIMFMAIASAVIGGTLLTGGSGTVIGAFLGACVLGILKDGFTISGVSAYTFDMILGIAIVVTMMMNVHLSRLRTRGKG